MNNNAHHPQSESQWWLASDGRWYPPELRSNPLPPPPPASAYMPTSSGWSHVQLSTAVHELAPQESGTRWSMRHSVVVAMCVLWLISPVDLLPELILGPLGFIDDGFALVVAIVAAGLGLRADAADGPDER
jgi:hypothetical protein